MRDLLIVDVQYDFMSGGSLSVLHAEQIIKPINKLINSGDYDRIIFTQDWHPDNHISFDTWPKHCVADTTGARINEKIQLPSPNDLPSSFVVLNIKKGMDSEKEEYSAISENNEYLFPNRIVDVCGLATDYCVKATVLDLINNTDCEEVNVILNACRGVASETTESAIDEMFNMGANIIK